MESQSSSISLDMAVRHSSGHLIPGIQCKSGVSRILSARQETPRKAGGYLHACLKSESNSFEALTFWTYILMDLFNLTCFTQISNAKTFTPKFSTSLAMGRRRSAHCPELDTSLPLLRAVMGDIWCIGTGLGRKALTCDNDGGYYDIRVFYLLIISRNISQSGKRVIYMYHLHDIQINWVLFVIWNKQNLV